MRVKVFCFQILYSFLSWIVIIITTHGCAFHIDTPILIDGMYELVLESESEHREAQVNLTEVDEDPN